MTSTTTVPASGTTAGTVIVQIPATYVTTTRAFTGTGTLTGTTTSTIQPSGTTPGTIVVQTPLATLNCDPNGYLIQSTSLYRVNITTANTTLIKSPVGDGRPINAMGYNVADNFLYASIGTSGNNPTNIIKIAGNGDSVIMGLTNMSASANCGDIDENSQFWISSFGQQWMKIDLKPGSATYGRTVASGTASPPYTPIDWAYVPGGGSYLYSLGRPSGNNATYLMQFDTSRYTWSTVGSYGNTAGDNAYGAVYASDDGYLYGSENTSGQIWRFSLPANGTQAVKVSSGPVSSSNDGARCIYAANLPS